MANENDAQFAETAALEEPQEWTATLHFDGVVGFNRPVDLFQYTERGKFKNSRKMSSNFNPLIRFDPVKYPPTKEGCAKLMAEMKDIALREGSLLIHRSKPRELSCFRCRLYASHEKREQRQQTENSVVGGNESASSESHDKTQGSKKKPLRFNKRGEIDGRSRLRSVSTLPTSKDKLCKVAIRIDTVDGPDGYIFLRQGRGQRTHKFHPKPLPGELIRAYRNRPREKKRLTESFIEAQKHIDSNPDNHMEEEDGGEADVGRVNYVDDGGGEGGISGGEHVDNNDDETGDSVFVNDEDEGDIRGGEHADNNDDGTDNVVINDAGEGDIRCGEHADNNDDETGDSVAVNDAGEGDIRAGEHVDNNDETGDSVVLNDAGDGDREGNDSDGSKGGGNEWLAETNNQFFSARTAWITDDHLRDYFEEIIPFYRDQRSRKRLIDLITKDVNEGCK